MSGNFQAVRAFSKYAENEWKLHNKLQNI